ncbi:hypothetical protein EVAR_64480_1 [Eumeta japonica]|uniref:Uncharacterized protein n=1 Tax=Eumeta variegata TaxID=151549 RepID=A0A4C1ZHH1_EUMVA|nr:hypothetical protein EVAR_64480_1 [Eumeta japonica]
MERRSLRVEPHAAFCLSRSSREQPRRRGAGRPGRARRRDRGGRAAGGAAGLAPTLRYFRRHYSDPFRLIICPAASSGAHRHRRARHDM